MTSRTEYVEVPLKTILNQWADGYSLKDKKSQEEHIYRHDWFVVQMKGKVIFRLDITDNPNLVLPTITSGAGSEA